MESYLAILLIDRIFRPDAFPQSGRATEFAMYAEVKYNNAVDATPRQHPRDPTSLLRTPVNCH